MRYTCVVFSTLLLALLSACTHPAPPTEAYVNRGGPEALLDSSAERVDFPLTEPARLSRWIAEDQPSRAEIACSDDSSACREVMKVLELNAVPYEETAATKASVTLIYDRVVANDCNARYVDNVRNYHNTNHPAFGCALSANMLRQITNKEELIAPAKTDKPSAVRAVNDIKRAYTPREVVKPYTIKESLSQSGK